MQIVKSEMFGSVQCDFWQNNGGEIFVTRDQIGTALEYTNPSIAIAKIHSRHKDRIDKFSTYTKLVGVEGGRYVEREQVLYSAKGIYEICRWSHQDKADEFYDMVYDILEMLRSGDAVLASTMEKYKQMEQETKRMNAEARLLNAKTRQAMLVLKSKDGKMLSPQSVELLEVNAFEVLTGNPIEYRPQVEKTYSAKEIGVELGVSSHKIGKVANANNLKTPEYGIMVLDKSPYSSKQVESFRYNENGRSKLKDIIKSTSL